MAKDVKFNIKLSIDGKERFSLFSWGFNKWQINLIFAI